MFLRVSYHLNSLPTFLSLRRDKFIFSSVLHLRKLTLVASLFLLQEIVMQKCFTHLFLHAVNKSGVSLKTADFDLSSHSLDGI